MKYIVYISRVLFGVIVGMPFWIYGYAQEIKCSGGDAIVGVWLTQKQDSKVEIVKDKGGTYSGKLIWVAPPNQKLTGTAILKGVVYQPQSRNYNCPWVFDPKINVMARAVANISNDTLYLNARKGFFTKSEFFTRVGPE